MKMFKKRVNNLVVILLTCLLACVSFTVHSSETIMGYTISESLFPPKNFVAEEVNDGVQLTWEPPSFAEGWFSLASDEIMTNRIADFTNIGSQGLTVAQRYDQPVLNYWSVSGGYLSKVRFAITNLDAPTPLVYTIRVWTGGSEIDEETYNEGVLIHEQTVPTSLTTGKDYEFVEVELNTLVPIPTDVELWVGVHVNATQNYSVLLAEGNPNPGYGNLIKTQNSWNRLNNMFPFLNNVIVQAYAVENPDNPNYHIPLGYILSRNLEYVSFLYDTTYHDTDVKKGDLQYDLYAIFDHGASLPVYADFYYWGQPQVINLNTIIKYRELFNHIPYPDWTRWTGRLESNSQLTPHDTADNFDDWSLWQEHWRDHYFANYPSLNRSLNLQLDDKKDFWAISPEIYLGDYPTDIFIAFEMAYTMQDIWGIGYSTPGDMFAVVISLDNGATWSSDNIIARWDHDGSGNLLNDISHIGESVIYELYELSGSIRIGFYGRSETSASISTISITDFQLSFLEGFLAFPPPQNLTAAIYDRSIILHWEAPEDLNKKLAGYRVIRDNTLPFISGVLPLEKNQFSFIDDRISFFTKHSYQVVAVYTDPHYISEPSNEASAMVFIDDDDILFPPADFQLSIYGDDVLLEWEAPVEVDSRWFSWSGDTIQGAFGTSGDVDLMVAHMYQDQDLLQLGIAGKTLSKVAIGIGERAATDLTKYTLMIWTGSQHLYSLQPGHLVYEKEIPLQQTQGKEFEWIEIDIDTQIYLPFGDDIWIGYRVQGNFGNEVRRPIGIGGDVDWKVGLSNLIFWNQRWQPMNWVDEDLDFEFSIQAYATSDEPIRTERLSVVPPSIRRERLSAVPPSFSTERINAFPTNAMERLTAFPTIADSRIFRPLSTPRALLGYRVYLEFVLINHNLITEHSYFLYPPGHIIPHYYSVSAVYPTGESILITDWISHINLSPPTDLSGTSEPQSVKLTWQKPQPHLINGDLIGYKVYRNGVAISGIVENEVYDDTSAVGFADNTYVVRAVYENPPGESIPSNEISVYFTSEDDHIIPVVKTELLSNFPNPFNPETIIRFNLANNSNVILDIYNIRGQRVHRLVNDRFDSGRHSVIWNGTDDNGRNVGSGVYFYRMQTETFSDVKKMMLLK